MFNLGNDDKKSENYHDLAEKFESEEGKNSSIFFFIPNEQNKQNK